MSETEDLRSLIFTRTLRVPITKEKLFEAIENELHKLFPPIIIEPSYFFQAAWKSYTTEEYVNFCLDHQYFYIRKNFSNFLEPLQLQKCEKLRVEFKKNFKKIIADTPSYFDNGYPLNLHIDVLKKDESGCEIEIECHPFLYYNILQFKAKVENMEKEDALLRCKRYLKNLATGLKAKEIDRTESNIAKFTKFLGIDRNWMSATYALQLQEVSITKIAQKKGISLKKENVERILNCKITKGFSFDHKYKAFAKEIKRRYDIEIPSMANWLRKMRHDVLHEGINPSKDEAKIAISATVALLKELKKVYEA